MSKPYVFVSGRLYPEAEKLLAEHCEYKVWKGAQPPSREELKKELAQADGLITSGIRIDDELLSAAPRLRIVSNVSVGYNNFDIEALKKHQVLATHTPYVLDDTVADLIITLMLAAARRVTELDAMIRAGKWDKPIGDEWFGVDVHHARLGIIGMGRIGEAVARRARFGFEMDVCYYNRSRKLEAENKLGVRYVTFDELLETSDFVVLMTPLTKETEGLIGREQFAKMKRTAIFVNASRGQTVDEEALVEALKNGTIRAAGLDVFCEEPLPPEHPLTKLPNTVLLPHIGSATVKTRTAMSVCAVENMIAGLRGETPPNVIPELRG